MKKARWTAKQVVAIEAALSAVHDASFECGDWTRDDDEPYAKVWARSNRADARLRKLLGLPPKAGT